MGSVAPPEAGPTTELSLVGGDALQVFAFLNKFGSALASPVVPPSASALISHVHQAALQLGPWLTRLAYSGSSNRLVDKVRPPLFPYWRHFQDAPLRKGSQFNQGAYCNGVTWPEITRRLMLASSGRGASVSGLAQRLGEVEFERLSAAEAVGALSFLCTEALASQPVRVLVHHMTSVVEEMSKIGKGGSTKMNSAVSVRIWGLGSRVWGVVWRIWGLGSRV